LAAPVPISWLQAVVAALSALLFVLGAVVYARVVARLRKDGGAVRAGCFELPDLLVSVVLATFFGGLVVRAALRHAEEAPLMPENVLPSSLVFAVFVLGVGAFLVYRGKRLAEIFGLARLSLAPVCGWAALLLLGAIPFVGVVNAVTVLLLKNAAEQQPLVELFRAAALRGDASTMLIVLFAGVVIAPLCEEFLFRGYFYGVGKRYAGAWLSGLVTAALFAAFHASLTSLAGLFVLALALTLAYERTGTLAVPMTMHALFNATSLGVLYLQATNRLPK
jgi:membrane protease YdiL (CAAX protease family)